MIPKRYAASARSGVWEAGLNRRVLPYGAEHPERAGQGRTMLFSAEARLLGERLDQLQCTNPEAGDGLFTYVLKGEPHDQSEYYESHLGQCEYCRVALEVYRYKRDVIKLLGRNERNQRG
jgi:hypothetical protein